MHPTVFYGSDRNKLASFVEDTRESRGLFAADGIAVNQLQFLAFCNFDSRNRRQ